MTKAGIKLLHCIKNEWKSTCETPNGLFWSALCSISKEVQIRASCVVTLIFYTRGQAGGSPLWRLILCAFLEGGTRFRLQRDKERPIRGSEVHAVVLSILFSTLCCCDVITGMVDGNAQITHPQNKGDWREGSEKMLMCYERVTQNLATQRAHAANDLAHYIRDSMAPYFWVTSTLPAPFMPERKSR